MRSALAALTVIVLLLAACGGDGGEASTDPTATISVDIGDWLGGGFPACPDDPALERVPEGFEGCMDAEANTVRAGVSYGYDDGACKIYQYGDGDGVTWSGVAGALWVAEDLTFEEHCR
jgi:hypothetical protein